MDNQYKQKCGNDCGTILSIDTNIMCWCNKDNELTLCRECYFEAGYYEDDQNDDNKEEIAEYKSFKKIKL